MDIAIHFHSKEPIRRISQEDFETVVMSGGVLEQVEEPVAYGTGKHKVWYAQSHAALDAVLKPGGMVGQPGGTGDSPEVDEKPTPEVPFEQFVRESLARIEAALAALKPAAEPVTTPRPPYRRLGGGF